MIISMSEQLDTNVRVIPEWTLGWRIQRALAQADLKSGDLEAVFEVSRNTVSRWLNDWYRPKDHVLKQIALMCGVSPEWLQDGDATNPHPAGPNGGSEGGPRRARTDDLRIKSP